MADVELRCRVAAHAMGGLLANCPQGADRIAEDAIKYADALLARLELKPPTLGPWGTHWEAMARTCCSCKHIFADLESLRDHIGVCIRHPLAMRCANAESDRQLLLTALVKLLEGLESGRVLPKLNAMEEAKQAVRSVQANMLAHEAATGEQS